MSGKDRAVLSFHESLLRESDVDLLRGPHWLNDQIISFYFEYLERVALPDANNLLFVSPEVTQCLKIVSSAEADAFLAPLNAQEKKIIFFALNDNENNTAGGSHWSLLVLSRPEDTFYHFDSSGRSNCASSRYFCNHLRVPLACRRAQLVQEECLQQTNCYDCGLHLICTADKIAHHAWRTGLVAGAPQISPHEVAGKRKEILAIIRELGGSI
ncbi:sentrin-specific protease 8 [Sergentomyia squamirostris]